MNLDVSETHLFSVQACCNKASWGISSDDGLQFQGLER